MALEHLSDDEYQSLKSGGLSSLSDEAYSRLKLPTKYGKTEQHPEESFLQHEMGANKGYALNDISGSIAHAGVEANKYLQKKAGEMAEESGKEGGLAGALDMAGANVIGTGAEALIPQNRLGVQLYGLQALAPFIGSLAKAAKLTPALEEAGVNAASKAYQYAGIPAVKADLMAQNLGKIAKPEEVSALNNAYKSSASQLGISKLSDTLGEVAGATGEFQKTVGKYAGELGAKIIEDPINSSYQQLHNVIEAVSAKLDAPWAYPGTENMRTLPKQMAQDLYALKQRAQWGMLAKAMHEVGNDVPGAADRLDAVEKIVGLRKDLAIAKSAESVKLTPSNLSGSQNQLGTFALASGIGSMLGSVIGHGEIGAGTGAAMAAIAKSPALMNSAILNARAGAHFLPYAPGFAALSNNKFNAGPNVRAITDSMSPQETPSGQ